MGQASSELSGDEVNDESRRSSDLGISQTLRRRGIIINLEGQRRRSREEATHQGASRQDQDRPDGRSTGGGRYDLRVSYSSVLINLGLPRFCTTYQTLPN